MTNCKHGNGQDCLQCKYEREQRKNKYKPVSVLRDEWLAREEADKCATCRPALPEPITIKEMREKLFENTSYGCPHCGGLLSVTGSCMNDCGWEKDSKPETPRAMALWRAGTCCEIGKKAINGETETPSGSTPLEYALYNLLCAVQDIARAMEAEDRKD